MMHTKHAPMYIMSDLVFLTFLQEAAKYISFTSTIIPLTQTLFTLPDTFWLITHILLFMIYKSATFKEESRFFANKKGDED